MARTPYPPAETRWNLRCAHCGGDRPRHRRRTPDHASRNVCRPRQRRHAPRARNLTITDRDADAAAATKATSTGTCLQFAPRKDGNVDTSKPPGCVYRRRTPERTIARPGNRGSKRNRRYESMPSGHGCPEAGTGRASYRQKIPRRCGTGTTAFVRRTRCCLPVERFSSPFPAQRRRSDRCLYAHRR